MADIAVLTAVLNRVVDLGGNLAVEEGTRLYWFPEDIGWIVEEMRHIQAYLQDADRKQVGTKGMAILIRKIRDIAYDMEDLLDAFLPQMASYSNHFRKSVCIFCKCFASRNFAMKIAKIKRRIEDIDRPKGTYDITADNDGGSQSSITWDPRRSYLYADEPDITGFDGHIRDLKSRVLGKEMKLDFISIVGIPGVGKTTLAKKVFKLTKQQFQCSALVYVSQQPNIEEIQRDIARQVGLEEKWDKNLESNLFEYLKEKRYVILFDDIWKNETWDALKISIPINSENGSRIIVTSQNSRVGRYIGGESSLHKLKGLDEENSWQLFCKMIICPVENELENISRKIVEKCHGVPLAIVVAVGLLRERERRKDTWSEVLNSMGSHQDNPIMTTLALSFNDLPFELKPCFLYFGLFPEDYEVPAFQLINLWIAEKFIKVVGSQMPEEAGEAYLNKLIARNLIQVASREGDGRVRSCRIHDLLHKLCISKAKDSNFFDTCNNLSSISAVKVRRITTYGNESKSEWAHQTPKLRSFLSFGNDFINMKQLKNLCKTCGFLRVLNVNIDCRTRHRVYLPNEIGNLIHLIYLEIRVKSYGQYVRFPDTISNLKNLLTLDLGKCTGIVSLPPCFRKMRNLRHILLPRLPYHCRSSKKKLTRVQRDLARMDFDEVSLPNLQTLTSCHSGVLKAKGFSRLTRLRKLGIDCCTEETLAQLSHKFAVLHELDDLHLAFDSKSAKNSAKEFDLSLFENLSKMHIEHNMGKLPSMNTFPPSLTKLTLVMTDLEADSMDTLGKLPKLKILILGQDSYMGLAMVCARSDFPQLELLEFSRLDRLKELTVEEGGMPRLHKLIIRFCYKLKMLPERLQHLIVHDESMINESCVLRVNIQCDVCKHRVTNLLRKIDGVYSTSVDAEQGKVTVTGNVDPATLLKKLGKAGRRAELWEGQKASNNIMNNIIMNIKIRRFTILKVEKINKRMPSIDEPLCSKLCNDMAKGRKKSNLWQRVERYKIPYLGP